MFEWVVWKWKKKQKDNCLLRGIYLQTLVEQKEEKITTKMIKSVFKHFSCCYIIVNEKEDEEECMHDVKKKNRIGCLMAVQEITAHPRLFKMWIWIDNSSKGNRKNHPLSLNIWWYSQIVFQFKEHDIKGWTYLLHLKMY